jgi:hypothetical protein
LSTAGLGLGYYRGPGNVSQENFEAEGRRALQVSCTLSFTLSFLSTRVLCSISVVAALSMSLYLPHWSVRPLLAGLSDPFSLVCPTPSHLSARPLLSDPLSQIVDALLAANPAAVEYFLPGQRPAFAPPGGGSSSTSVTASGHSSSGNGGEDTPAHAALPGRALALARAVGGAYPFATALVGMMHTYGELLGRLRNDGMIAPAPVALAAAQSRWVEALFLSLALSLSDPLVCIRCVVAVSAVAARS